MRIVTDREVVTPSGIPITDRVNANSSLANYAGTAQACGVTVLKPVFYPIQPPEAIMPISALSLRVSTLQGGSTLGLAVYSYVQTGATTYTATLVCQLNASISGAAAGVLNGDITLGAAGAGAGIASLDFSTTRYIVGQMASDITTLRVTGASYAATFAGLGILSWTAAARSTATDWPASFSDTSAPAISGATTFGYVDLLSATGKQFL